MGELIPIPKIVIPDYSVTEEFTNNFTGNALIAHNTIMEQGVAIIDGTTESANYYLGKIALNIAGGMVGIYGTSRNYYVGYCYPANCYLYEGSIRNYSPRYFLHNPQLSTGGYHIYSYQQATTLPPNLSPYSSYAELEAALSSYYSELYPITYSFTNSIVNGPEYAVVDETVIVSAIPNIGYGITDASTQILVTNDDVSVPYTWDAQSNRITFTMPQPATNRGGFGSTGQ